ncbi:toll-like receptor 3 [Leptidea sinapis]|uniref:toll-like receptor 3 n=1 Tax=Leptidea sinapis TaxID=189913 RepID=UPI0021C285AF|nr:toll-like receptor 3 [Leptidea sinapis]
MQASNVIEQMEFFTLYGNNFGELRANNDNYETLINATNITQVSNTVALNKQRRTSWSAGFKGITFHNLKELDLRSCQIDILDNFTFKGMPAMQKLYLGENKIHHISANAFSGLRDLIHLDLSRNMASTDTSEGVTFESYDVFDKLPNLALLDFSFTTLTNRNTNLLERLGKSIQILSLCYTALNRPREFTFRNTSLVYMDLSGNLDILNSPNILRGLERLRVLFAEFVGLRSLDAVSNLTKLEILKVNDNELMQIDPDSLTKLNNLQIIDLSRNKISSWFTKTFDYLFNLKMLILKENNINVITEEMLKDIKHIRYIAFAKNFMVCFCQMREMYNIGLQNEFRLNATLIRPLYNRNVYNNSLNIQDAFSTYNNVIRNRRNVTEECFHEGKPTGDCFLKSSMNFTMQGDFLFVDYDYIDYSCLGFDNSETISISKVTFCNQTNRYLDPEDDLETELKLIYLLIIPAVLLPVLLFIYAFRRNFRYCLISMRNSAMLSLINTNDIGDETKNFNYDVFVSYCNEDRAWVLDQLLPHVEKDCNISVCLHERDFQVGLSILENIVSCMDRSKSIMLIISQRFLLSQWCQFEMHLAQHRLLETRREDLILILLEEIPRRLRPNTLHYLMLTKTYVVWPKEVSERDLFWRRMKKSLAHHRMKIIENDSLA